MKLSLITKTIYNYKQWKKGVLAFTLLELLIVIVIIAVLLALVAPKFIGAVRDQQQRRDCENALEELKRKLEELKGKLQRSENVNPQTAKSEIQALWNAVNTACGTPSVTGANQQSYNLIITDLIIELDRKIGETEEEEQSFWEQLKQAVAEIGTVLLR